MTAYITEKELQATVCQLESHHGTMFTMLMNVDRLLGLLTDTMGDSEKAVPLLLWLLLNHNWRS